MGGETSDHIAESDEIEELGSVGDWRLPDWTRRISGLAWLFIGLAIVDFAVALSLRTSHDDPGLPDASLILGLAAHTIPVLLPALVITRGGGFRPRISDPLFAGSVAVALGILIGTVSLVIADGTFLFTMNGEVDVARAVIGSGLRIGGLAFSFVGPVLLARSILRRRQGPTRPWAVLVRVAIFALTGAYVAYALWSAFGVTLQFYASPHGGMGAVWMLQWASGVLGTIPFLSWAYLASVVLTASGARARPRLAWVIGLAAMSVRQAELVIYLGLTVVVWSTSTAGPTQGSDMLTNIVTVYGVAATLSSFESVLFTAAFGAGLGGSRADESDTERIELEPLPSLG